MTTVAAAPTTIPGPLISKPAEAVCGDPSRNQGNLREIVATDPTTVTIRLCQPDPSVAAKLTHPSFMIVPAAYLAGTGGTGDLVTKPVGTGPYRLVDWSPEGPVTLARFDDYWGTKAVSKSAVIQWQADDAQRAQRIQLGASDVASDVHGGGLTPLRVDTKTVNAVPTPARAITYLAINARVAPFTAVEVRRALASAINRAELADALGFLDGLASPLGQLLPAGIAGHDPARQPAAPDAEGAKAVLGSLAAPGTTPGTTPPTPIVLAYPNVATAALPAADKVAAKLRDQLAAAGLAVEVQPVAPADLEAGLADGRFALALRTAQAAFPDARSLLGDSFTGGLEAWAGPGFDAVRAGAAATINAVTNEDRAKGAAALNAALADQVPAVPLLATGGVSITGLAVEHTAVDSYGDVALAAVVSTAHDQVALVQAGAPKGLYCADETDAAALQVCAQIGETLVRFDPATATLVGGLAESFTANKDLTEWTFKLRPGVLFHNGQPLTADDVVASLGVPWNAADPTHKGRTGAFATLVAAFGGMAMVKPNR